MPPGENSTVPLVLGIVVCDGIYTENSSHKKFVLGIFDAVGAASFPCAHRFLTVFAQLTDGYGEVPITIKFVRIDGLDEHEIMKADTTVNFPDPRSVADIVLPVRNLPLPQPGEYRFQLFCRDEFLIERRITVLDSSQPQAPPSP